MKTYVLNSTSMKGGILYSWNDGYWENYRPNEGTGLPCRAGGDSYGRFYVTNILFDRTMLDTLRSKNIISIRLALVVVSGTILSSGTTAIPVAYKLNNKTGLETTGASDAWVRSDAQSTAKAFSELAYIASEGSSYAADNTPITLDLTGSEIPMYGYCIGSNRSTLIAYNQLSPSAVLTVVTDEETSFTVSYNKGAYGTGTNVSDAKTPGSSLTLRGAIFTRTGYAQDGWSATDGGAKVYELGASYTTDADITLYPHWTNNTFTVSYNKGSNGTGTNASDTKAYNTPLTLRGAIFTRSGFTQDGWSTVDGGAKAYALGGSYTENAAITLYPHWKSNVTQYELDEIYIKLNGVLVPITHNASATSSSDGLMSAADKAKLDSIAAGASVTGVKGEHESEYRSGNVNITKNNVGIYTGTADPSTMLSTLKEGDIYILIDA